MLVYLESIEVSAEYFYVLIIKPKLMFREFVSMDYALTKTLIFIFLNLLNRNLNGIKHCSFVVEL